MYFSADSEFENKNVKLIIIILDVKRKGKSNFKTAKLETEKYAILIHIQ